MGYVVSKVENQEIDISNAQVYGAYTNDFRFFNGLKIIKESFLISSNAQGILPDKTFYFSANIQYNIEGNNIIIVGAGGLDLRKRIVIPVGEMDISLSTFKQYVIDVNGSGGSSASYDEYGDDAEAAAGGVPVGGTYIKSDATGFGGLLAVRRN